MSLFFFIFIFYFFLKNHLRQLKILGNVLCVTVVGSENKKNAEFDFVNLFVAYGGVHRSFQSN